MAPLKKKKKMLHSFLEKETSPGEISHDHIQLELESIKNSFKDCKVSSDVLSEASPSPVGEESSWKWWSCCCCTRNFPDSGSHCRHVLDHLEPLHEDLLVFLWEFEEDFPEEWAKKLSDSRWTPIHVGDDFSVTEVCYSPTITDWDVSLMSTDTERTELLDSISVHLKTLLERKILHISHLCTILDYAMGVVEGLPSWQPLKKRGVDRNSTLCIRCLEAPQLEHVRDFLRKLELCTEEKSASDDDEDAVLAPLDNNNDTRVVLDPSRSSILIYVDQWFIQTDDGNGNASWKVDAEALVSWLYSGTLAREEALISWLDSKVLRNKLGKRILTKYETENKRSSILYELRDHWMKYKDALMKIESKCGDESKERSTEGEHGIKSLKAILEGWKESLVELSEEEEKVCINAITEVLKGAEDIIKASDNQNDGDMLKEDDIILKALAKEKDDSNMKLHLNTAELMKNLAVCRRLKKRLATVSCFDYLTIVIPMAKSFLREKWEADAISEALLEECKQTQEKRKSKLSKGHQETRGNLSADDANLWKPGTTSSDSYLKEYKLEIDVKGVERRLMGKFDDAYC